jgi:phosphoglycolate phosphatase-like HAD superfamily hydrolase
VKKKNVIILDLDGVLITTPHWKRDALHEDGYSFFNDKSAGFLNSFLSGVDAELWLISDRRKGYTLEQFNVFFKNRKIEKQLDGVVPVYDKHLKRIEEFQKFIQEETISNYLLIDDDSSLDDLKEKDFWVKTSSLIGFNEEKLSEAKEKIKNWKS